MTDNLPSRDLTIREKLHAIERMAAEVMDELPQRTVSIGSQAFFGPIYTFGIGEPLVRIRRDAATVLSNLPRGTK